jgi:hypothetical protein
MKATDVIEAYVTDVAVLLPRRQRNDVAYELRALLNEGLLDKADEAGRSADAAMATEFVRAFGRPADVAARYRPTLTIIDPAYGHAFLRAAIIGLLLIWALGLVSFVRQPIGSGRDFLQVLGQWWGATLIPSMWWPGVLVVGFGIASWLRGRSPRPSQWTPRAGDRIPGGHAAMVMGLLGVLSGLAVLIDPRSVLDLFFAGRAAPAAYEALTYTESFRRHLGLFLIVLLALNIPLFGTVIISGRWSPSLRRIDVVLRLVTCATMAWAILDGPVFLARSSDQMMKLSMAIILVFILVDLGIKFHRSVRPTPSQQPQA